MGNYDSPVSYTHLGVKEQWFKKSLDDSINLPGSMPEKLKGDEVTVRTQWTGSLYDSSYYFNPVSYTHLDVYKRQALAPFDKLKV